jgi:hypothetical protein
MGMPVFNGGLSRLCRAGDRPRGATASKFESPHRSGLERQFFHKELNLMKSAFPIVTALALFVGASTAHAARPMGQGAMMSNRNIILPAPPVAPVESSLPPPTNSAALAVPLVPQTLGTPPVNAGAIGFTSPAAIGVPNQSFGALPGNPGSATYDPNAALPSLNNQESALAPTQGTSAAGFNTPSTGKQA